MESKRISFVGPSGSGKTTCMLMAEEYYQGKGLRVIRVDVAHPLRMIQNYAQTVFGLPSDNPYRSEAFKQDGILLAFLASHYEKVLTNPLIERINLFDASDVVFINGDCRNNAYGTLKGLGFKFIKILTDQDVRMARKLQRGDLTFENQQTGIENVDIIREHHLISNNGSLDDLRKIVLKIL